MPKITPMLFNSELVRALLAGNKTQTRRIMKPQPTLKDDGISHWWPCDTMQKMMTVEGHMNLSSTQDIYPDFTASESCPFGDIGSLIYVRETTLKVDEHGYEEPIYVASENGQAILECGLAPSPDDCVEVEAYEIKQCPSIHMPRKHSRLTLKITDVRVERIQDISEYDAKAEGFDYSSHLSDREKRFAFDARTEFHIAWDQIYGDSWNKNEWVWVIEFEVIHKNVDLVLAEMGKAA